MAVVVAAFPPLAFADELAASISKATENDGVYVHTVECPFQAGRTQIRVVLPQPMKANHKYPVIYVLPVEAQTESRYGDGLKEVIHNQLPNKYQVIFVAPTFSQLPWYADHPTERSIRQESYLLNVVLPFIEAQYPAHTAASHRLLLGFSKSGWGAWTLLLRHPNFFGRAAAWDAPLMMDRVGKYGTTAVFATQENFEKYRVTDLLRLKAEAMAHTNRLILLGYGNFREEHHQAHALMEVLKIPHEYRDGPRRTHDWHSGWLAEAVELLVGSTKG